MGLSKFTPVVKNSIVELYGQGYNIETIAKACGVTRQAIHYWIKKFDLREELDEARTNSAKESIEVGLRKLASGVKEELIEDEFVYNRRSTRLVEDEDGEIIEEEYLQSVNRKVKTKVKPPEVKAIEVLARKYYKEFDHKAEERELTSKVLEGFTMRELQEARKNNPIDRGKYIEAEFQELSSE